MQSKKENPNLESCLTYRESSMRIINTLKVILRFLFINLFVFIIFGYNSGYSQTNFSVKIDHLNYEYFNPEMEVGLATITYDPGEYGKYMSIGAFDLSQALFGIIVDNVYLPSSNEESAPHSVSVTFNLGAINIQGKLNTHTFSSYPSELIVQCHLFDLPTPPASTAPLYPPETLVYAETIQVTEIVDNAIGAISSLEGPQEAPITYTTHTFNDGTTRIAYKTNMPNLDLDASVNDISWNGSGDKNACVPTSSANSLKFMENEFESITLREETLRDVMEILSMFMSREYETGVNYENTLKGILNYIEDGNIPLEVKFQSDETNDDIKSPSGNSTAINRNDWSLSGTPNPSWEFLMQMMEEKEDVTICYRWKNPPGSATPGGAHAVCLSGAREFSSGVKKISFKHDFDQDNSGGAINQHEKINIDNDGAMRFGPNNKHEIYQVIAKSPIVQEGDEGEGLLNEFFGLFGSGKLNIGSLTNDDFIEVALHKSIQNLDDYRISLYEGIEGTTYQTLTLDEFEIGATLDSRIYYYYNMPVNTLRAGPAGISISYTGTVLPGQFISYGGSFLANEGDATGKISVNIENFTQGESLGLIGSGSKYSDFTWSSFGTQTPGDVNPGQNYTLKTQQEIMIPDHFSLSQNYPNPFNPNTTISYSLSKESDVTITVYNMLGKEINLLISQKQPLGKHSIQWNGTDHDGNRMSAGIYFYELQVGGYVESRKMVLLK
jgi:hypothetical protein